MHNLLSVTMSLVSAPVHQKPERSDLLSLESARQLLQCMYRNHHFLLLWVQQTL